MLRRRGELLILAKQRVHDSGYNYRKGRSRSKSYGSVEESTHPKRIKTTADERYERIRSLKEEVKDLKERVSYKRKRIEIAEVSKNYKLCDQLSEEVSELSKTMRLLEVELNLLQKKEKKSQRYYQRKRESDSDSSSSHRSCSSSAASSIGERSPPFDPPVKRSPFRLVSPPVVSTPSTSVSVSSASHEPVQIVSCDQEGDLVPGDGQAPESMLVPPTPASSSVQQSSEQQAATVLGDDQATPLNLDQLSQPLTRDSSPQPADLPEEMTVEDNQSF